MALSRTGISHLVHIRNTADPNGACISLAEEAVFEWVTLTGTTVMHDDDAGGVERSGWRMEGLFYREHLDIESSINLGASDLKINVYLYPERPKASLLGCRVKRITVIRPAGTRIVRESRKRFLQIKARHAGCCSTCLFEYHTVD